MFEYAISCGEGTLLDYGLIDESDLTEMLIRQDYVDIYIKSELSRIGVQVTFAAASPDRQTGK